MNQLELINAISGSDVDLRWQAVQTAQSAGPGAIAPLAKLMAEGDGSEARAASEAMKRVVYFAARPGAGVESKSAALELQKVASTSPSQAVRRDAIHYLGDIGGDANVAFLAILLSNPRLREDARMALERIGSKKSLSALADAMHDAPVEYRKHLQQSLDHSKESRTTIGIVER
ncbi:MAG: HEAT repeat domain-containing protein [Armatimonadota bacterium]